MDFKLVLLAVALVYLTAPAEGSSLPELRKLIQALETRLEQESSEDDSQRVHITRHNGDGDHDGDDGDRHDGDDSDADDDDRHYGDDSDDDDGDRHYGDDSDDDDGDRHYGDDSDADSDERGKHQASLWWRHMSVKAFQITGNSIVCSACSTRKNKAH